MKIINLQKKIYSKYNEIKQKTETYLISLN